MKRAAETQGAGSGDKSFRRQNPVSCRFCRSKKLKCDRSNPCSNCVARNITCVSALVSGGSKISNSISGLELPSRAFSQEKSVDEFEARLKRIEQAIFQKKDGNQVDEGNLNFNPSQSEKSNIKDNDDDAITKTAKWIETAAGNVPPYHTIPIPDQDTPSKSYQMFESTPTAAASFDSPNQIILLEGPITVPEIISVLPDQASARLVLDFYVKNVNWVFHILHSPTIVKYQDTIYADLANDLKPKLSHLAVTAGVLAIGAYFWSGSPALPYSAEEIRFRYMQWIAFARKALDEADHYSSPTIEGLQTTILLTQLLPHLPESNSRSSALGALITTAHKMQIHQVDSAKNIRQRAQFGGDMVDLEIKRRTWWTLVSCDWLLAAMTGPQSGTYFVQPDQMKVALPSVVDDEDITNDGSYGLDYQEDPTELSYTISKIRLAMVTRELVDVSNRSGVDFDDLTYDQVLQFDKKFNDLLETIPWFFKLDEASLLRSQELIKKRPYIAWQRSMCHFGFHTRLSRLHRPYLARGYKDPRYAYSRMICLRSARLVIELESNMRVIAGGNSGRLWIIIHHFFVATLTLVMDYCCHRADPQAAERKAEIMSCCRVLEQSQHESSVARMGLEHLKNIMNNSRNIGDKLKPPSEPQSVIEAQVMNTAAQNQKPRQSESESQAQAETLPQTQNPNTTTTPASSTILDSHRMVLPPLSLPQELNPMEGSDPMQDLWLDPFEFDVGFDPQWERMFRDINDPQVGLLGFD